jgi:hypothetical protein
MPGGDLEVSVGRDYALILRGPVSYVGEMTFEVEVR